MPRGEISHVQRSGRAIDEADADQEQQGRGEIDCDVVQARLDPQHSRTMQNKSVGGCQQQLEKYEQIEQIAGQKGAI